MGCGGGGNAGLRPWRSADLGRAVAGLNAYGKGVALGLFQPTPKAVREQRQKLRRDEVVTVDLLHRAVPAKHTDEGLRALSNDKPISPESVKRYLRVSLAMPLMKSTRP